MIIDDKKKWKDSTRLDMEKLSFVEDIISDWGIEAQTNRVMGSLLSFMFLLFC